MFRPCFVAGRLSLIDAKILLDIIAVRVPLIEFTVARLLRQSGSQLSPSNPRRSLSEF